MLNFLRNKSFKCFTNEYGEMRIACRTYRGVKPIKLKNIVGIVGRCHPDGKWEKFKWSSNTRQIEQEMEKMSSLPLITVYKVGCQYYVVDGHHRTAAAMEVGKEFLDAEVYEYKLSGKKEQADYSDCPAKSFRDKTGLIGVILRSGEQFQKLKNHICHLNKNVSLKKAARFWYENIFLPFLRSRGKENEILTESEYYLQEKLEEDLEDENSVNHGQDT